jgi:hypothetical protein
MLILQPIAWFDEQVPKSYEDPLFLIERLANLEVKLR